MQSSFNETGIAFQDNIGIPRFIGLASILSLAIAAICLGVLQAPWPIPLSLAIFGILNLHNFFPSKIHRLVPWAYHLAMSSALITTTVIAGYTGGISSTFMSVLIVLALISYCNKEKTYTICAFLIAIGLFSISTAELAISRNFLSGSATAVFSLLSFFIAGATTLLFVQKVWFKRQVGLQLQFNAQEEELERKNTLLKEIHHRVKNNLQTVSSLLSLQSKSIEDIAIKNLFKESQNRVICMAMVHEMLYQREDLSKIEYRSYIEQLTNYLLRSSKGGYAQVKVNINVPEIRLNVDTAIPLGLIINETVTNSLKYGFINETNGEIYIALKKETGRNYILEIGDNGVGYSGTPNNNNSNSLGLKLIKNLTRQLKGSIEKDATKVGTNYIVKFQESEPHFHSVA